MKTSSGQITATGSANGWTHTLNLSGPDIQGAIGLSGTFSGCTFNVVGSKIGGGAAQYPIMLIDRSTGARYQGGTFSPANNTPIDVLFDCRGMQFVTVYCSAGTPTAVTVEAETGQASDFGGPLSQLPINFTTPSAFASGVSLTGGSGVNEVTVPTALANAAEFTDGTNSYLKFNSSSLLSIFGQSLQLAKLLYESQTTGLTAHAGGGQGSALLLTTEVNAVTTVATAGDSVKLPVSTIPGATIMVANLGANPMQVYGSGTDTINGVATATGVSQMPNSICIYICYASGLWVCEGIGGGFSGSFQTVSNASGITAHAGGGQGSAVALTAMNNRVTTVATIGDSVILPANAPGMMIGVFNAAGNSCNVFPDTGSQINGAGANVAYALAGGHNAIFYCLASGVWHAISGT